ncbi:AAC(3) family N-acetyltransferase [Marinifilum flexuosum]|uniref:AAC(3) family N-acetyltransferase n=1 Tax=Marinifilum flexuosum TaxID=1117708 RepID=UPI0024917E67|nr:AAC(3) family N-acetyltransferase [Marinifilum flexuosum]
MIKELINRVLLSSPYIETAIRSFYWNNIDIISRYAGLFRTTKKSTRNTKTADKGNFNLLVAYLKEKGVKRDDILIIHSSFEELSGFEIEPIEIIEKLFKELVPEGTLLMPAIRAFKEEGKGLDYLRNYIRDIVPENTKYDLKRTTVSSGILPFYMMRHENAVISEFPLNPLVAIGKDAKEIMHKNLSGDYPTAHGMNSAWQYCSDKDAWNIGLGVREKDYLTIFHVAQEGDQWPVKDWFFERKFTIKNKKKEKDLIIKERRRKWTKFYAELNFYNDLKENDVMNAEVVEGISVLMVKSKRLMNFMSSHENPTYPYFIPKKYYK